MTEERKPADEGLSLAPGGERSLPLSRRRLIAGAISTLPVLPLASRFLPDDDNGADHAARRQDDGTGPGGTPDPNAPPVADPAATPGAGGLQIVVDQRPTYAESPVAGGTLRLAIGRTLGDDFNPTAAVQDPQIAASYLDPLVWVDEVTLEPKPWLAERWSWNDDGTEITYDLRRDVRWHDGSRFTAHDARFSLYAYRDDLNSAVRNFFVQMREVDVVDDYTLVVRLRVPDGGWIFNASNQPVFQRAQYGDFWTAQPTGNRTLTGFDWSAQPPVGTGPWRIESWRDRRITFARNADYWAGAPHCDALELSVYESPEARLQRWLDGQIDLLWLSAAGETDALGGAAGTLYVADAAAVMFAAFNFDNPMRAQPLFTDVRARQALSTAIDRPAYANDVFRGFIQETRVGTIAQPWAHDTTLANPPRDLTTAKRLLTEAGWLDRDADGRIEDGNGVPLRLVAILREDSRPELAQTLTRVAADLRQIGIEIEIQALDPLTFRQRWAVTRDYDLIAFAYRLYAGFTDFDLYGSAWDVRVNPQGFNPGGYSNPAADEAISEAMRATDLSTLRRALADLQGVVNDDLFGLWFGFPQDLILARPDIRGFQPNKLWQTADTRKLWRQPT